MNLEKVSTGSSDLQRRLEIIFAGLFVLYPIGMAGFKPLSSPLLALMVVLGIVLACLGKKRPSRGQFYVTGGMLLLVIAVLPSFSNVEDMSEGFKRLEKLIDLLCLLPIFYGAVNCRYALGPKLVTGLLIAAPVNLVTAAYSLWILGLPRAQGQYDEIIFGDMTMLAAMLLLSWLVSTNFRELNLRSSLIWLAFFASLLTSFLSGTRGALLAIPPVLFWLIWDGCKRLSAHELKRIGLPLVGLVLVAVLFSLFWGGDKSILQRYSTDTSSSPAETFASDASTSDAMRMDIWRYAGQLFVEYPLFGTGIGDFRAEITRARQAGLVHLDKNYKHAHSIYLGFLGMTGLTGFLAMIFALFILPVFMLFSDCSSPAGQKQYAGAALVVVICFAAFGLTEQWLARSAMVSSFVVCLAAFFPLPEPQRRAP